MIEGIFEHFKSEAPKEACGLLLAEKNKVFYKPCINLAQSNHDFVLNPVQYVEAKRNYTVLAIIHSHTTDNCEASSYDIQSCNRVGIPYMIFAYPSMQMSVIYPNSKIPSLAGRNYVFGLYDCFSAVSDYYRSIGIDPGFRKNWKDGWWDKENYMNTEEILSRNFVPAKELKPTTLLVFSVDSTYPNHIGVYTGDGMFFHHARGRLSCEEPLMPFWSQFLTGKYYYEA